MVFVQRMVMLSFFTTVQAYSPAWTSIAFASLPVFRVMVFISQTPFRVPRPCASLLDTHLVAVVVPHPAVVAHPGDLPLALEHLAVVGLHPRGANSGGVAVADPGF